jgi:hypothetical protein
LLGTGLLSSATAALAQGGQGSPQQPSRGSQGRAQQPTLGRQQSGAAERAIAWFNQGDDGLVTRGVIISNTSMKVREAADRNENISLTIGRNLSKRQRAYQVWVFADDFFVFPLTSEQESAFALGENSIITRTTRRKDSTSFPLAAEFRTFNVSNAQRLKGSDRITGSVISQPLSRASGDYALRLTYITEEYTRQTWLYLPKNAMPPGGVVEFSFDAINGPAERKPHVGPLALFLVLCAADASQRNELEVLHSNATSAMVNVVAG